MKNTKPIHALLLVVVVLGMTATPVFARRSWCWSDPVFAVDGDEINVVVELAPYEAGSEIGQKEPVKVELKSPKDTNPQVVLVYGAFPEEANARMHAKKDEVHIQVKIPKKAQSFEALRVSVYKNGALVARRETDRRNIKIELKWPTTEVLAIYEGDDLPDE